MRSPLQTDNHHTQIRRRTGGSHTLKATSAGGMPPMFDQEPTIWKGEDNIFILEREDVRQMDSRGFFSATAARLRYGDEGAM